MWSDGHHSMLEDRQRVGLYRQAIEATVRPGDVVLDVGTGTGFLSVLAARAGARKVYAIEQERIASLARRVIARNGLSHVVEVIERRSDDVTLPERADVLVTETIGSLGFDEGIVDVVRDARARNLRPEARIIPRSLRVYAAPVHLPAWSPVVDHPWTVEGVNVSPLSSVLSNRLLSIPAESIPASALLCEPALGWQTGFTREEDHAAAAPIRAAFVVEDPPPARPMHGVLVYFAAELAPGVTLDRRPGTDSSWNYSFFPLPEAISLAAGARVDVEIVGVDELRPSWTVTITERDGAQRRFHQTPTFNQALVHEATRVSEDFVPTLSEPQRLEAAVLSLVDGTHDLTAISAALSTALPTTASLSPAERLARVRAILKRHGLGPKP